MRATQALAATLLLAVGTAAAQERAASREPAPNSQGGGGWFSWMWPFGRKAEAPKTPLTAERRGPTVVESAMALRRRELLALQRRQAVCLRLMEIADRTHDADLRRQAEELDALAWDTYNLRTAHLASGAAAGGPDEDTLARRAGPGGEQPGAALLRGSEAGRDGGRLAERRDR
jgi:hypothetical protein